jgi:hypothetical protein
MRARTCFRLRNDFLCCTCAPNPTSLKARLTVMSNKNLLVSNQICFVVTDATPNQPLVTRVTQCLFFGFPRSFGCIPLCLSILPPTSFLRCTTEDRFMLTEATTLRIETPLLSCTKVSCYLRHPISFPLFGFTFMQLITSIPCIDFFYHFVCKLN